MESAEHAWIGDQLSLHFPATVTPAKGLPLALPLPGLPAGARLTYGQTIALAGDFFGVVGAPISTATDRRAAFTAAFASLGANWAQTLQILSIMAEEIRAIDDALAAKKDPSTAYAVLGDSLSMRWNVVTGGENVGGLPVVMGRYLQLAAENWDHFTEYAVAAYSAGHELAMEHAAAVPGESPAQAETRMQEAYALNAFADHFLTDLFSAGHLRAPRKELSEQVATPIPGMSGTMGSLLVRCMHDEDSHNGLKVSNAAGNSWVAYGDKRLLDAVSGDNRAMVVRATQASADDVWSAHLGGQHQYTALSFIPDLARVADVSTKENFSPLFHRDAASGVVQRRNDVSNRSDFSWTSDWWGWSTWAAIMAGQSSAFATVRCYSLSSGAFLGWLGVGTNNYVVLVGDEKQAHGLDWYAYGNDLYLRKNTSPAYRYIGEGVYSYADWGLWGGNYKSPVIYNPDSTLTLKGAPGRSLYLYKDNQLCWSNGETDLNFVRVELPFEDQYATF